MLGITMACFLNVDAQQVAYRIPAFKVQGRGAFVTKTSITAQRKLVEVLYRRGAAVFSPLTYMSQGTQAQYCIEGFVKGKDSSAVITCVLRGVLDDSIAATTFSASPGLLKDVRNTLGEALLYGLGIDLKTLQRMIRQVRPVESTESYALYKAGARYFFPGGYDKVRVYLEKAFLRDRKFAMACWLLSDIYRKQEDHAMVHLWQARAITIDPSHPRWKYEPQDTSSKRVAGLAKLSRNTPFKECEAGLGYKELLLEGFGIKVGVWEIDPAKRTIAIAVADSLKGNTANELQHNDSALVAINGGFFEMNRDFSLEPSGLLVSRNQQLHKRSKHGGSGVFYKSDGNVGITWIKKLENVDRCSFAMQCGPMIIEPDSAMGIYHNSYKRVGRTAVGIAGNKVVFVVVGEQGSGLDLYELAQWMRLSKNEGGLGCRVAMNLDGGLSSQGYMTCKNESVHIDGLWKVQNALVVK